MIAGTIIGLIGSILPEIIKFFKDREDRKHELRMLELQLKYQKEMTELRIAEATAYADLEIDKKLYDFAKPQRIQPTGSKWLDALQVIGNLCNQMVRPTLTFIVIVFGWLGVKFATWQAMGGGLDAIPFIWHPVDNEFVGAVFGFWFGGRALRHTVRRYIDP